jgi:uncharacterized protein
MAYPMPTRRREAPPLLVYVAGFLLLLFLSARTLAAFYIDYHWWQEVGQLSTWTTMLSNQFLPFVVGIPIAFALLWIVHARALKFAGTRLSEHRGYARLTTLGLFAIAFILTAINLPSDNLVRFYGSIRATAQGTQSAWRDPVFGLPLSFHLFEVPFYQNLAGFVLALSLFGAVIFAIASKLWEIQRRFPSFRDGAAIELDFSDIFSADVLRSVLFRSLLTVAVLALVARIYLGRYELLTSDHGFLFGMDYVDENVRLPLRWVLMGSLLVALVPIWLRRLTWLVLPAGVALLQAIVPGIVSAVHVKPNELTLQRPYIERHLKATREAFGLESRVRSIQYNAQLEAPINATARRGELENIRLWDWRAFHDTITQIQALRQYYTFRDTDVDRYQFNGSMRQVMLSPREIDIRQLADARANWINTHFVYTHGYGVVMADAHRIEPSGYPYLLVQDAPPKVNTADLKLTRPEIYFGEQTHEPVFVRTNQPEFNYPSGSENVHSRYEGRGGIPMNNLLMRVATTLAESEWNILLTNYFTNDSRMMINRNVSRRLEKLAGFIDWDTDPYLVVDESGRLIWMVDGYTDSDNHPYSRPVRLGRGPRVNYIRNAVKATIDAYDGTINLYVFDEADPIIAAWRAIYPNLFRPASEMPADLRAHARYPEGLFRVQVESYRAYHITDPESFYNREDLWDLAKRSGGQENEATFVEPTYLIMQIPGESRLEYVLSQVFTPRNKDNLIGMMVARCDGEKLGEIVVLQLSKQSLVYGPLQVDARIDSDEVIAKDLSLWNQQGSRVIRGQILPLPIENTFLYVEPIYIQSQQARMPQLKKVVIGMGNRIIYRDTFEEALSELTGSPAPAPGTPREVTQQQSPAQPASTQTAAVAPPANASPSPDPRVNEIRTRLRRYRELAAQGKWAEAGRELEAIEGIAGR